MNDIFTVDDDTEADVRAEHPLRRHRQPYRRALLAACASAEPVLSDS